ncbi:MAG: AMP-binding protein [Dactylosporangium sp.]|nr:AMP-binding protein [Dactylosporangium sp.]NNJ59394.1 AMP-binding protein [Dactylosporangium sp.]
MTPEDVAANDRPWLDAYAEGVPHDIDEPAQPLTALLDGTIARFGSHVALDFFGSTTTYDQLGQAVAQGAEVLRRLGVRAGDRVALILPNCPQHVAAFYAALRLGAIVVEHNPLYTADELSVQLADHGARVVICWEKTAATIDAVRARTSVETIIAVNLAAALPLPKRVALRLPLPSAKRAKAQLRGALPTGTQRWESLVASTPPLDPAMPSPTVDDIALLQYTGGTTGTPKGAMLTHRNLAANARQGKAWVAGLRDGEETFLAVLPLFHAYGLTLCLTFAVSVGARLVLLPRFEVDQMLATIRRCRPTFLPGVPTLYERLAEAAETTGADLTSIRFAISGAMSLPERIVDQWERHTGGLLVEGYGMTETSPVTVGNPISLKRRPGSVGVPFPSTRARVVDPDDPTREYPPGKPGELLIAGPQVFSGYWRRPDETAAALLPGGWIRTGDLATMDQDGFITIVDRIKEMIITGGFNVYPSEVEQVLVRHPEIADAAVVGLPARPSGEHVAAAIIPVAGAQVGLETLRDWCRQHIAGYKIPRQIMVLPELPRNQVGKVLRRVVREQFLADR